MKNMEQGLNWIERWDSRHKLELSLLTAGRVQSSKTVWSLGQKYTTGSHRHSDMLLSAIVLNEAFLFLEQQLSICMERTGLVTA